MIQVKNSGSLGNDHTKLIHVQIVRIQMTDGEIEDVKTSSISKEFSVHLKLAHSNSIIAMGVGQPAAPSSSFCIWTI